MKTFKLWLESYGGDEEKNLLAGAIENLKKTKRSIYQTGLPKPENWDGLLVYADWLEEHGDPISELIRLVHEYLELSNTIASQPPGPSIRQTNLKIASLNKYILNLYQQFKLKDVQMQVQGDHIDRLDPNLDIHKLKSELVYYLYSLTSSNFSKRPSSYVRRSLLRLLHWGRPHGLKDSVDSDGLLAPEVKQEIGQLINHLNAMNNPYLKDLIQKLSQITEGGHELYYLLKNIESMAGTKSTF